MPSKLVRISTLLILLTSLLIFVGPASAELKANNAVYAWEEISSSYRNSNVTVEWDGGWIPFIHRLNFDRELYTPDSCTGPGTPSTSWAGQMEYGLYHTDNSPSGAQGFQETRNWKLVDCDRDGDGSFDNDDRSAVPPDGFTLYRDLSPASQDVVVACGTGNCLEEIVTTLEVNLDDDCDGVPNSDAPELVCFYAEARVPDLGTIEPPYWSGPLQARVTAGGGDKTVNFSVAGPTAITLKSLSAKSFASNQTVFIVMISLTIIPLMCLIVRQRGY